MCEWVNVNVCVCVVRTSSPTCTHPSGWQIESVKYLYSGRDMALDVAGLPYLALFLQIQYTLPSELKISA